jgi:hypothetical protein
MQYGQQVSRLTELFEVWNSATEAKDTGPQQALTEIALSKLIITGVYLIGARLTDDNPLA